MADEERQSALAEFWKFSADFKSVSAWVAKAAIAAPLTDLLLNIGPPWPSRPAVAIVVCIVEVFVLMYSFEFWRKSAPAILSIRQVMRYGMIGTAGLFVIYILLFSLFVVEVGGDRWDRRVVGFSYHEGIGDLVASNPTTYTAEELLERFNNKVTRVWTSGSVKIMQVIMLVVWLALWVCLSSVIASFVSLQWRHVELDQRKTRKKRPAVAEERDEKSNGG